MGIQTASSQGEKLTPKQSDILGFLHDFIDETGHSPGRSDFVDRFGQTITSSIATDFRRLQIKSLIYGENCAGLTGIAFAVFWVDHPALGYIEIDGLSDSYPGRHDNPFSPFSPGIEDRKIRDCMCCAGKFLSEHKFNRLCATCSVYAAELSNDGCWSVGYTSNLAAIGAHHVGGFMTPYQILAATQERVAKMERGRETFAVEGVRSNNYSPLFKK